MFTFLGNKTISKTTPLLKENPFPQFNVVSHKRPGIRLSFECTTTLLSGEGGEERTGTATMFRKMLSKYSIVSTVLSKIVAVVHLSCFFGTESYSGQGLQDKSKICDLVSGKLSKCLYIHSYMHLITSSALNECR